MANKFKNNYILDKLIELGNFESVPGLSSFNKDLQSVLNIELEKRDSRTNDPIYEIEGFRIDEDGIVYKIQYGKDYIYGHKGKCIKDYDYLSEG